MSVPGRPERVGAEIQAAVGELLSRGALRDPRIGYITITGVKMSPDLRLAKGFVRREVTARVKLRVSPEVFFVFDKSVGEGDKIDRLLREVKTKEGW